MAFHYRDVVLETHCDILQLAFSPAFVLMGYKLYALAYSFDRRRTYRLWVLNGWGTRQKFILLKICAMP